MTHYPKFSPAAFLIWLALFVILIIGYFGGPDTVFRSIALVILFGHLCVGVMVVAPLLDRGNR